MTQKRVLSHNPIPLKNLYFKTSVCITNTSRRGSTDKTWLCLLEVPNHLFSESLFLTEKFRQHDFV